MQKHPTDTSPSEDAEPSPCVEMHIRLKRQGSRQAVVLLDINFFTEEQELPLGKVFVGITHGRLRLVIKNGVMPQRKRRLKLRLPSELEIQRTETASKRQLRSWDRSLQTTTNLHPDAVGLSVGGGLKGSTEKERCSSHTDQFTFLKSPDYARRK